MTKRPSRIRRMFEAALAAKGYSKSEALARILIIAVLLSSSLAHIPFGHAHLGGALSSWALSPPTINGVLSPGEWDNAAQVPVFGGSFAGSTFYVMNDANNLYLALSVADPTLSPGPALEETDSMHVRFDNAHNGVHDIGDDGVEAEPLSFLDLHFVPTVFGGSFSNLDAQQDGSSAASNMGGLNFFEVSHPLNSGDTDDFALSALLGGTIGFCLAYFKEGTAIPSDSMYPVACLAPDIDLSINEQLLYGDVALAPDMGDADGDGLLNDWEANGLDVDGDGIIDVDLPSFGASPFHKDLFLEFDWVTGEEPTRSAIQKLKAAFAAAPISAGGTANPDGLPGINLWVDTGGLTDPTAKEDAAGSSSCSDGIDNGPDGLTDAADPDCLVGDNLGGGNAVVGPIVCLGDSFYDNKAANFDLDRRLIFRYGISGDPADSICGGGQGEIGGNDFIEYNHDAGTIMHEFGHNLNLRHGGFENDNCKPNYVSVMNYDNQFGILQVGGGSIIDYSAPRFAGGRGLAPLPTLVESDLDESILLDPTDSSNMFVFVNGNGQKVTSRFDQPVDWNGDGDTNDSNLIVNIDTVGLNGRPAACSNISTGSSLEGHDDWSVIALNFRPFGNSADAAINPVTEPEPNLTELLELQEELQEFFGLEVTKSFTDPNLIPLPMDDQGNPKVDVVIANGKVSSTNPGQVLALITVTNILGHSATSLTIDETLPVDWSLHPDWDPATGAIHVFFEFVNGTRAEITDPTTITVTTGDPETVMVSIADIQATTAGKSLGRGESIIVSVKMTYSLKGTTQSALNYPISFTETVSVTGYSRPSFDGLAVPDRVSASFTVHAKVVGDVNGDFSVGIVDASLSAYAFDTRSGDARWNPDADFDYNSVIDILDLALLAYYYGTSS